MDKILENRLQHAQTLFKNGDFVECEKELTSLLSYKETSASAFYLLGIIELNQKNFGQARKYFENTLIENPNYENAHYYIGVIEETVGDKEKSFFYYQKTLELNKNHKGALDKISKNTIHTPEASFQNISRNIINSSNKESEFYQRLLEESDPTSKKIVSLLEELNFRTKPTIYSHVGQLFFLCGRRIVKTILFFIFGGFFLFVFYNLYKGVSEFSVKPSSAGPVLPPFFSASYALIILLIVIAVGLLLDILEINNKTYEFAKGRILITSGILVKRVNTLELYRIIEVEVSQDFFQQLVNSGTISLKFYYRDSSKEFRLIGLAHEKGLRILADKLREVVLLLRSVSWIKGIVN